MNAHRDIRRFFTTTEVATYCAVSSDAVIKWVRSGKLRGFTTPGGHYRISEEDFRDFLARFDMPLDESFFARHQGPRTVLVVDDDPDIRDLAARMLAELDRDLDVETARDGYEAGIKLGDLRPDLVILDVMMPGIDGITLCRSIRDNRATAETRILAITGLRDPGVFDRLYEAGADVCLDKPLRAREFRAEVERLLAGPRVESSTG